MNVVLQKGLLFVFLFAVCNGPLLATTTGPTANVPGSVQVSVTASNGGILTCANPSVTLSASSTDPGVSYNWTGPNGFTSSSASPVVSLAGTYTVTATNSAGTGTSSIAVTANTAVPAGVFATNSGVLTCNIFNVALTGNSTTAHATFSWTGPNGFTASGAVTSASTPGLYTLTATNPANGCISSATTSVLQNITAPQNSIIATNSGVLTCANTTVTLTGSSTTTRALYNWGGPNSFNSNSPAVTVSATGNYTLTVTNPANGCTSTATVPVTQNITAPVNITTVVSNILSCNQTSVTLTANSTTSGATYTWTGPGSFTASTRIATITQGGVYTLVATDPANGCSTTKIVTAVQDTATPANLVATNNGPLTCSVTSVTLTGSSTTAGTTYQWTGPNGFFDISNTTTGTDSGTYTLIATNPGNGCIGTTTTTVAQDITGPTVTTTANPVTAQITCNHPNIVLTSSTSTAGVTYNWSGPVGFTATGATATATAPGTYTVSVADPANGCVTALSTSVTRNINGPVGLSASTSWVITCISPTTDLQGASTTPGATFLWTGPEGFTASTAIAETSIPGNYTLVVTNPIDGCTSTTGTIVVADTASPANVTASNNGPLNCLTPSVTLTSSSTTAGVDYLWVTPDDQFISGASAVVTTGGVYTILVDNNSNGCESQATTTVLENGDGCPSSIVRTPVNGGSSNQVSIQSTATAGDAATHFEYKTYPNPFSDKTSIEFSSPNSAQVTVEICNSMGIREKMLFNNSVAARQVYKLTLEATHLAAGIHFCMIKVDNKVYTGKLLFVPERP